MRIIKQMQETLEKKGKEVCSYFTVYGTVRIKPFENVPYRNISDVNNLKVLFSEEQIFMS